MAVSFDPTKEVPNPALCEKLEELGCPQNGGGWYWYVNIENANYRLVFLEEFEGDFDEDVEVCIKAPTVRKLGEWIEIAWEDMSVETSVLLMKRHKTNCHFPYLPSEINPDLLAKDLIWLAENGHVKFKEAK